MGDRIPGIEVMHAEKRQASDSRKRIIPREMAINPGEMAILLQ